MLIDNHSSSHNRASNIADEHTLHRASVRSARRRVAHHLSVRERPVVTAEEAFRLLGIDRSTGYKSIRDGTFPVPVLRVGRLIRVPTVALVRLLQLDDLPPTTEPEDT